MPSQIRKAEADFPQPPGREVVSAARYRRVRRVAIAMAAVIALPSIVLVALLIGVNPAVRSAVVKMTNAATGVPAALDEARVNIVGGVHLTRLSIGSPKEFQEVRAFRLARLDAAVSLPSLFSKIVEIHDVLVVNPELTIEFGRNGMTNWGVLMKQLTAKSRRPVETDVKFMIQRIRITNAVVVVRAPSLPKGVALRLRDIELEDIGSGPGGAAPFSIVLTTVVQALITGAIEEWTGIPGELGGILSGESARTSEDLGKKLVKPKE